MDKSKIIKDLWFCDGNSNCDTLAFQIVMWMEPREPCKRTASTVESFSNIGLLLDSACVTNLAPKRSFLVAIWGCYVAEKIDQNCIFPKDFSGFIFCSLAF